MNGIPKINFEIGQGLGRTILPVEKVPALLIAGEFESATPELMHIFNLEEAEDLGITEANTPFVYNQIKSFYDTAGQVAELFIVRTQGNTTNALTAEIVSDLMQASENRVAVIGVVAKVPTGASVTIVNGLAEDVTASVITAHAITLAQMERYKHLNFIISGTAFNGTVANLADFNTSPYSRVSILLSNTDGAKEANIGLALGRLAAIPVQRKLSRVKDGAVTLENAKMTDGKSVESYEVHFDTLHNKGYIFLRSFIGRSGYYFSSDRTCTGVQDDFSSIARGQVMGEAVRITYNTLVEEISDEIPVTANGNIHPAIVKAWQGNIEREINAQMTSRGKISGVRAFIDENQDILSTDEMEVVLNILPVGYADYITVKIGFTNNIDE